MAERVYNTRRRISIMPRLAAYREDPEEDEEDDEPELLEAHSELLRRLQCMELANQSFDEEEFEEDVDFTAKIPVRTPITPSLPTGLSIGAMLRSTVEIDLTRSQTFDDGEGQDSEDVFKTNTCQSKPEATPTDHTPKSSSDTNQPPRSPREENLLKKRSLTKQPTMPELAERQEQDATSSVANHDVTNHTASLTTSQTTSTRASPTTAAASSANSAFPSLPDDRLKELGLYRQKGDSLDLGEQLSDQELEEKFACLSLAFKTDKLTLEKRIDLHERARDIAEQNVNKEIEGLKEAMKTLSPFCTDAQSRDLYSKVQHHVEVLEQSTSRVSSRAEVHGAVQQELRMSKAIEVMVNHVENLKRLYDKEHQELEETKKLLQENKMGQDGDSLQKRSYSVAGAGGLKLGGRRRASVAVLPRKLSTQGVGSSSSSDHPMDPKTRFQTLISNTALKASVLEGFRRSISLEQSTSRPVDRKPADFTDSQTNGAKVNTLQGQTEVTDKKATTSSESSSGISEEEAFQKGYEEGVRAQLGAEFADLREQHRIFYDSLEHMVDQNEVSDEEELRIKSSWVEMVWKLWPQRGALGQKLRFTLAGFVFLLALVSLLFTFIPVGSASERKRRPYSWTAVPLEEILANYVQVHHQEAPPY